MATPKKLNPQNRGGPKRRFIVDDNVIAKIEELGNKHCTQQQMCDYFGISETTWYENVKKFPRMAEAIKKSKVKNKVFIVNAMHRAVEEGNVTAMIFLLKTQHGFSESNNVVIEDKREPEIDEKDPIEAARIYKKLMEKK